MTDTNNFNRLLHQIGAEKIDLKDAIYKQRRYEPVKVAGWETGPDSFQFLITFEVKK